MKISLETRISLNNMSVHNGYGYATDRMLDSLTRLGYVVNENDPSADVAMWFDQPQHWTWRPGQYKIGFLPWESTHLPTGWLAKMNECDEIWTPSPVIADWFRAAGVSRPVYVYEHGVDHKLWTPQKRDSCGKIKFLHVGAEAARKGGWDTLNVFRRAFAHRDDVELTLKMVGQTWAGMDRVGKTNIINKKMSLQELISLFHRHHVFVYPSFGEGFGLTPLQAMATGMPTICTAAWAPYERFLDDRLAINSELKPSQWPKIHPGKVFRPDFDEVIDAMLWVADNYDEAQEYAAKQVDAISIDYDWDRLTRAAFDDLAGRLKFN